MYIHMLISVPCVGYQPVDCMSPSDPFEPSQGLSISRVEKPAVALQAKSYPGLGFCHWQRSQVRIGPGSRCGAMASASGTVDLGGFKTFSGEDEDHKEYKRWKTWMSNKLLTLSDKIPASARGAYMSIRCQQAEHWRQLNTWRWQSTRRKGERKIVLRTVCVDAVERFDRLLSLQALIRVVQELC